MIVKQIIDLKKMPKYNDLPPCPETLEAVTKTLQRIDQIVQEPLLYTEVPLEGRSAVIRSQESNLGNMIADVVRAFYESDIALINSGGIRCDRIIDPSITVPLRIRDIIDVSPFDNAMVVRRVSGHVLALSLENSVSDAHTDGRFMQLSGLSMSVNWSRGEGYRVSSIFHHPRHGATPSALEPDHIYTVAMTNFIATGFDGYSCFQNTGTLIDAEGAMTDTNLLLEVFGGTFTAREKVDSEPVDTTTQGLMRARKAVIKKYNESDGFPIIGPSIEGRIRVVSDVHL